MTCLTERAKLICSLTVSVAAAFALSCVGIAALQVREAAVAAANDVDLLTSHSVELIEQGRESADQARHVMLDARLTLDNLNRAAIAERQYAERELPDTVQHINGVLNAAQTSIAGLQETEKASAVLLRTVNARAEQAELIETNAASAMQSVTIAVQHVDATVTDPHVAATLEHLDVASAAGASTMQHADATAADTQQAWHTVLHPAWPKRLGRALRRLF